MFKYFWAVWYYATGRFSKARETLMENQHVMAATYDKAIKNRRERFLAVKNAVAELITIETNRTNEIKELGKAVENLGNVKNGTLRAMQNRIDALQKQGKTKEEIVSDSEYIRHKAAFEDASSKLDEKLKTMAEKEGDLKTRQGQIATYKAELQSMQRANEQLREEKQEAIADVQIAKQSEEINSMLAGIPSSTDDNELTEAREARKRAQSRAKITAELAGNDAKLADANYAALGQQAKASSELDKLLSWGDEDKKTDLDPAKLPES